MLFCGHDPYVKYLHMKKVLKRGLIVLLLLLVIIQFFRPAKNTAGSMSPQDIGLRYQVPAPVNAILKRSCYDCHSDNTVYPWYSNVQPLAWWLDRHIQEGKRELNFSLFAGYSPKKAAHKLDEIITEVGEREMPLSSYLAMHPAAKLSDREIALISAWADKLGDSIRIANNLPLR